MARGLLIAIRSFLPLLVLLSASVFGQTTVVRAARMLDVASGEVPRPGGVVN
jgi:hypothetical protein